MSTPLSPEYWNQRYAEAGFAYGERPNAFLASQAIRLKPGGRVLVPGDGEGRNGVWLAEQGFEVTSLDMSQVGCEKAAQLASARGVSMEVICTRLEEWTWPTQHCDAVVSIFLHLPEPLRTRIHRAMRESLVPGGIVLMEAFTPAHLPLRAQNASVGGPGDIALLCSAEQLRSDFAPLEPALFEEAEVDLEEGAYHRGRGAVIRAIFVKPSGG